MGEWVKDALQFYNIKLPKMNASLTHLLKMKSRTNLVEKVLEAAVQLVLFV